MLQALLLPLAYQTKYYDQLVDHFGFGTATFRHRYLYNDTFWGTKGPLLRHLAAARHERPL